MALLSADQVEAIHEASLHILENFGIEVMSARALALFERAGAKVDHATQTVRLDRGLVDEALKTTPSAYRLTPRNPRADRPSRRRHDQLHAGRRAAQRARHGARPPRRQSTATIATSIRLAQHFNCIHMLGNQVCAPVELPANSRHLDTYFANLTLTDKSFHVSAIGRGRALDGIEMMAIARGMTLDEMRDDPGVITIISVNSPRRFDDVMAEGLMAMAEHGQSVAVTPFTLMGAMSPVTLAGALAQQNAEALFGVVLTQLVRPGAPVMYGAFTSNVDMRSGAPAFGTPENTKANIASGQLARRYGLPYRTTPGSASNAADAQGAYETSMALWGAVLGDGNLVYHAAGWQEGGLTASFEKFILDVEMIQHMMEFLAPDRGQRGRAGVRRDRARCRPAAISSASSTRWRATRPPSTSRCCPTGRTTKPGRRPAGSTPRRAPRGCGRRRWGSIGSRRWTPPPAKRWRPMSPGERKRSGGASRDGKSGAEYVASLSSPNISTN